MTQTLPIVIPVPAAAPEPLWFKDAIIYELHVKAFADGNGDGIGDFPGLTAKLPYLQELGVNTLWLLPFYPSPMRDDGYDIADYRAIHPALGTMADFRTFMDEAHRLGLRIITELVINHTSDQHAWFQAARRAPAGSALRNYYVWSDTDTAYQGTRIIFTDTEKSNWAWDEEAHAYYWHRFFAHQPDLNFANPVVFEEMMAVMEFWLDAGVDGMRLDAVPYICEREGTSNENLPETHAILKRMRRELDLRHPGRMFLAEANQWPEDVREYFGAGDECHMAYHFPLMPRIYMAIAQEDRHPIVEIIEQTPDIPDTCQWAVFLRNHDELTLEMVTDRERDYLYQTYAQDPQARLNLGIRRRLAPLVDNDRHRIELMNLLLMTLLGSPVLYYGDEIGMGDNLLLGDRDGVRTPMQWNAGPNAGFSVADPERLPLAPIVDPVYGFGAVNVESQRSNASSLFNWMRRLIALRKTHRAFSRGTLRFLHPGNRKILAYLREYEGTSLLCVANLSQSPQAVELDLSAFKGRVPVECLGRSNFPPVGELPYVLTLAGHGFYAFRLADDVAAPAWHEQRPALPELSVLVLPEAGWRPVDAAAQDGESGNLAIVRRARERLERQIIPRYFRAQPWFTDRDAAVVKFQFGSMHEWADPSGHWMLATVLATLAGGEVHRYAMPMALAWEDEEGRVQALLYATLAKVRRGARMGVLYDAFWDDRFWCALVAAIERGDRIDYGRGLLEFKATSAYPAGAGPVAPDAITRPVPVQGQPWVNLDNRLWLKAYRWLLEGTHPELELSRFLTETAKFSRIPQLGGTVEYVGPDGERSTWAILERYVENQGDAWSYTVDYLERFLDTLRATPEPALGARHTAYLGLLRTLGQRTAEFHQALALPDAVGSFGSEPIRAPELAAWIGQIRAEMEAMYELLEQELPQLPDAAQSVGGSLLNARPKLYGRILRLANVPQAAVKTRYHGDFRLGQVWLSNRDFVIANYGGEPGLTWTERRKKHTPLRDVAGLLISLNAAASAALDHVPGDPASLGPGLRLQLDAWERLACAAFFRSYRKAMAGHPSCPSGTAAADALMTLCLAERAISNVSDAIARREPGAGNAMRCLLQVALRGR
ncbi:MAG: maltose alpha-D-glucosyltransferase [Holophaga sp.]|nr:maltose alpha-D-glucosyltransferase [Holophaga sp.]